MVKFAHLADCHIGGWRDEKLKNLNLKAFIRAIDKCLNEEMDFVLISGDLFNTSLPGIDYLKETVKQLKRLKVQGIKVYMIPGSHDYSPSGKTMLTILEEADLMVNVVKGNVVDEKLKLDFTIDPKTGTKITGILGRKGMLEKSFYNQLDRDALEQEEGFKIFMFHSAISELKPKGLENMESMPLTLLPKNFNYYAGGHVHIVKEFNLEGYNNIIYPGPTFPNNFYELETLKQGGFYIYEDGNIKFEPINIIEVKTIDKDCNDKTTEEVERELLEEITGNYKETIITLRVKGILKSGKPSDINFKAIFTKFYENEAFFVMKNTFGLKNKKFQEVQMEESSVDEVENKLIEEYTGQSQELGKTVEEEMNFTKELMKALSEEKNEDEKNDDYDKRIIENVNKLIN